MIIPKAGKLTEAQMIEVEEIVSEFKCSILEIEGHNQCVYKFWRRNTFINV